MFEGCWRGAAETDPPGDQQLSRKLSVHFVIMFITLSLYEEELCH